MGMSFYFYLAIILSASFFGFLAEKFPSKKRKDRPNAFFIFCVGAILIFIMGFREISVGIDDYNYLRGYTIANSMSFFDYYKYNMIEPGFYLIYRIVYAVFNDFQWVIIISSTITVTFFLKSITFNYRKISIFWSICIFGLLNYYYYFGIVRLGIAVSIVSYALRYLFLSKKKFIVLVFIATTFHFSALFVLILLFFDFSSERVMNQLAKVSVLIPITFLMIRYFLFPFINIARYNEYTSYIGGFDIGFLTTIPLLIIFTLYYKRIVKLGNQFQLYYIMIVLKVVTEMFSPLIGIGRMVWYLNIATVFLIPATIRSARTLLTRYVFSIVLLGYSLLYFYNANFLNLSQSSALIPYRNIFFSLLD